MSGYQVQNPNFFVSLNPANTLDAQLAFLNASFLRPEEYVFSTGNSGGTGLFVDVSGDAPYTGALYFNSYIAVTGCTQFFFPSAADLVNQIFQYIKSNNGSQIVNTKGSGTNTDLRKYWNGIRNGFNYQIIIHNKDLVNALTLVPGAGTVIDGAAAYAIAAGVASVMRLTVTQSDYENDYANPVIHISLLNDITGRTPGVTAALP